MKKSTVVTWSVVGVVLLGVGAGAWYFGSRAMNAVDDFTGNVTGDSTQQPSPPPPSEKSPTAPGPDNTLTERSAPPAAPPQPPSQVEKQSEPLRPGGGQ